MVNHNIFMQRCLQLAAMGQQWVTPNPMVGAVVVKNGKIIGEGYHKEFGGPHAEVNAIEAVKDKTQLKGATIYVSLEPCAHFGKTPPCTNLIIEHKITKVVIACLDPNPMVAGKGVKHLKSAGIELEAGVLEREAQELNKIFFWFHTQKQPYVVLKWAQTADGFCGRIPNAKLSSKITNWYSNILVHKIRSAEAAILVGYNTALNDNPELTNRKWIGKNPLRIVLDLAGELPQNLRLFNDEKQTIVFTLKPKENTQHVSYFKLNSTLNIVNEVLNALFELKIQSVMIEGGPKTLQLFIDKKVWNEAHIFTSSREWQKGIKAPIIKKDTKVYDKINLTDSYQIFKPNYSL